MIGSSVLGCLDTEWIYSYNFNICQNPQSFLIDMEIKIRWKVRSVCGIWPKTSRVEISGPECMHDQHYLIMWITIPMNAFNSCILLAVPQMDRWLHNRISPNRDDPKTFRTHSDYWGENCNWSSSWFHWTHDHGGSDRTGMEAPFTGKFRFNGCQTCLQKRSSICCLW